MAAVALTARFGERTSQSTMAYCVLEHHDTPWLNMASTQDLAWFWSHIRSFPNAK